MNNIEVIKDLKPLKVFEYFAQICSIPHGSGNTDAIADYCVEFAKSHNLFYRRDEHNNVIIKKGASLGIKDRPTVIIQGHLDMVAVKDENVDKDLDKEGLELVFDGEYLFAKQTSLGADDGIAIAYALALLDSDDISHPDLEAVFTTDEEIGMLGATALDVSDLKGRIMLNIDSEEEGIFLAGCAGGATFVGSLPMDTIDEKGMEVTFDINGLEGGHSGMDIILQKCNANVLAGRLLLELEKIISYSLISINGGEKDNAIAKYAKIKICTDHADKDKINVFLENFVNKVKKEYMVTDPMLNITMETSDFSGDVCDVYTTKAIVFALNHMPAGVCKMSNDIKGLVQTSLNLGILRTENETVSMSFSVRSSLGSEKEFLLDKLTDIIQYLGGNAAVSGVYPAWEYVRESRLRDIFTEEYEKLYKKTPAVETIHAGVECGIIADKLGGLDCISFGPQINDIHTTKERLNAASVLRTWELIKNVLNRI